MTGAISDIATLVVRWQETHGRNHLPWQQMRDPYRVWLSEIMLQQTQVVTVLGYYDRFLLRFPDVMALAAASEDEVLALWSGLGYYSRARNLHRCAKTVATQYGGRFPQTVEALSALPGIGRSTAGAIAAFCFGVRAPILDANVRRVLTRVLGFSGDLAQVAQERLLWAHAERLLPAWDLPIAMPRYTQGLMDLGATVCMPKKPTCLLCPLQVRCVAQHQGRPEAFPVRTRKLRRTAEAWWLAFAIDSARRVWLQPRPRVGIWAGLYCAPVFESEDALREGLHMGGGVLSVMPPVSHVLTHKDLYLHPVRRVGENSPPCTDSSGQWFAVDGWRALGLPAPVRKLLETWVTDGALA